ncbi:hypothetical protein C8F01DRAFT_1141009 [Mycena amicta]|nr:hypothetical protein C8F01DRAFT_1141009 [Mycena amicta]
MTSMSTSTTSQMQMQMQMHTPPVPVPLSSSSFYPSPTGSASGLEFALQPQSAVKSRPRRTTRSLDTASSSQSQTPSPQLSATEPTAFHGLVDPYGLLLSVGTAAGCRTVFGVGMGSGKGSGSLRGKEDWDWDPSTLRGTRLAALVVPDGDHTSNNNTNPVDALFESWRTERRFPGSGSGSGTREVCVKMRCPGSGQAALPVQVIVRIVGPQEQEREGGQELPPFVMPAPLMYSVRLASTSVPSPLPHHTLSNSASTFTNPNSASTSTFTKLDPANGESESWQYEISQLKFANERLVEEIRALERVEAASASASAVVGGMERVVYTNSGSSTFEEHDANSNSDPQQQQQQWGYSSAPLMYQLPMKRPWDRRE